MDKIVKQPKGKGSVVMMIFILLFIAAVIYIGIDKIPQEKKAELTNEPAISLIVADSIYAQIPYSDIAKMSDRDLVRFNTIAIMMNVNGTFAQQLMMEWIDKKYCKTGLKLRPAPKDSTNGR